MCVGVPMRVLSTVGLIARAEGAQGSGTIDLALVGVVDPGTDVLVHLGVAVRVLAPGEASAISDALEAVRLAEQGLPFDHLLADLIDREPQLPVHLRMAGSEPEETHHERTGRVGTT